MIFRNNKDIYSYFLIAFIFVLSVLTALFYNISISSVVKSYQFSVIIILISMELFTNLISVTGIIEKIALKLSVLSKGKRKKSIVLFGLLMFIVSAFLNNITAVLIVLPIVFVLLKAIGIDQKFVNIFFAIILILSNTGGASSPIGDFPAIVIMNSGITSFSGYLFRAFPFFLIISLIIIFWWQFFVKDNTTSVARRKLSINLLQSKYKNITLNKKLLIGLLIIFLGMFLGWSLIPQNILPPEVIALLGSVLAMLYCSINNVKINTDIDFKPVLLIASFLFLAGVIKETGFLTDFANLLQSKITDPMLLLIVIMIFTSLISGIFSAGPATSAMMPVIEYLCQSSFSNESDWVAIAFAASICAGSSLFMWSATAGFILSKKVNQASLTDKNDKKLVWNIANYLKYGLITYFLQLSISILLIYIIITT